MSLESRSLPSSAEEGSSISVAYQSNETGRFEIVVQPFPGSGAGKKRLTRDGGTRPQWRGDGRELFYLAPDNRLMAVPMTISASTIEAGMPAPS